jgi:2'-5' RNA ligase
MIRLFIAAIIPHSILSDIIAVRDAVFTQEAKIKWEPLDKLHLTIKFLGDTEESLLPNLYETISETAGKFAPIETAFTRFGLFYRNHKPAILWAGLEATEDLRRLKTETEKEFARFGFEEEKRKFKPHITFARLKGYENGNKIKELCERELPHTRFFIEKIVLFKSQLRPSGSVYTALKSFELKNKEE